MSATAFVPPTVGTTTHPLRQAAALVESLEHRVSSLVRPLALPALRVSLGLVFVWFGALKVLNATPVADLVANTMPFLDRAWFVPALGAVEVVFGLAIIVGRYLGLVCILVAGHLVGTFLVFVTQPDVAFQHGNVLQLTTIGEFVAKNVVLISGALVLAAFSASRKPTR